MTPEAYHAMMFKMKDSSGMYQRKDVNCFCGANNYESIVETDRYDFRYNLCLCKECGILYTNPRMTEEATRKFYDEDYRKIYGMEEDMLAMKSSDKEMQILSPEWITDSIMVTMDNFELDSPKVVFEIGCGRGNLLNKFKDCDVTGVDWDKTAIEDARKRKANALHGGIEVLESLNKKADLIIMNHVLEHFDDLWGDLSRIRELLTDKGVLFISVPGLYRWSKEGLFQNAHNYIFNGNTLEYVMNCCGFDCLHLDEAIFSVWGKYEPRRERDATPEVDAYYIRNYLSDDPKLLPPIRVENKFSLPERRKNIEYAINSGMEEISPLFNIHLDSEAIIIGGGPSADNYVDKMKDLISKGAKTYVIERMYKWCLDRDIIPDYVIAMDASDDVIESFSEIHPDTTHLILVQCKPEIFDKLKDTKSYFFMVNQKGIDFHKYCTEKNFKRVTFINTGGTVVICALSVAMTLGARDFHVFGFDCHIGNGDYANGITGVGDIKNMLEADINGRTFKTTVPFLAFMQNFQSLYVIAKDVKTMKSMKIYGDSLVKHASKENIDGDKEE